MMRIPWAWARDPLLVTVNDFFRGRRRNARLQNGIGPADIIDSHHQDHCIGTRMTEHILVEARQRVHFDAGRYGAPNPLMHRSQPRFHVFRIGHPAKRDSVGALERAMEPGLTLLVTNFTIASIVLLRRW
jgi:hypothetical protein